MRITDSKTDIRSLCLVAFFLFVVHFFFVTRWDERVLFIYSSSLLIKHIRSIQKHIYTYNMVFNKQNLIS